MIDVMKEQDHYAEAFSQFEVETAGDPAWLRRLRKAAIARFGELGFPGPRDEDWKFTSVAALAQTPFALVAASPFAVRGGKLPAGVVVCSLAEAVVKHSALVEQHLGHHADGKGLTFTALSTAFVRDGVFVYVPPGIVAEEP